MRLFLAKAETVLLADFWIGLHCVALLGDTDSVQTWVSPPEIDV